MHRSLLPSLVVMLLAAPYAAADELHFSFPAGDDPEEGDAVDLLDDNTTLIRFRFNETTADGESPICSAYVRLEDADERLDVRLDASGSCSGDRKWEGTLSTSDPDLVVGAFEARIIATRSDGSVDQPADSRNLTVTADDDAPPTLDVFGSVELPDSDQKAVAIGSGETVNIDADDPLLRSVSYRLEGSLSAVEVNAPYVLSSGLFDEGAQTLFLEAEDRAGNIATAEFTVVKDTEDPELEWVLPETFYNGIPNTVQLNVSDRSAFGYEAELGGNRSVTGERPPSATEQRFPVTLIPERLGQQTLLVRITDVFGNDASLVAQVDVQQVVTDLRLRDPAVSEPFLLADRPAAWTVEAYQESGVTDVPVNVTVDGHDDLSAAAEVPLEDGETVSFSKRFPAGHHDLVLRAQAPEGVTETDPGNQTAELSFEVYIGRVDHDSDSYYIRVDDRGVPEEAVDTDDGTYDLELRNNVRVAGQQFSSLYFFEVDGQELYWNPDTTVTTIEVADPPGDDGEDDDNPIPTVWWALPLALGAVAWIRRR